MFKKLFKRMINSYTIRKKYGKIFIEYPMQLQGIQYMKFGKGTKINKISRLECIDEFHGFNYKPSLVIGNFVNIGYCFTAIVTDSVEIGDNTLIASNVMITTQNHGINPESSLPYHMQKLTCKPVSIGKNVWIGQNVCILPGVKIGDNCIVAAGSIVNISCEDNCMLAGTPARVIKKYDFNEHCWIRCK